MQALAPGTTDPAGLLLAASQYYSDKDARCESLLKALRSAAGGARQASGGGGGGSSGGEGAGTLPEAIQDCALTAGWVHRVPLQRELLRAAIYGRSHEPDAADAALIPLCSLHARLLNSLRQPSKVRRGATPCRQRERQPAVASAAVRKDSSMSVCGRLRAIQSAVGHSVCP